MKARLTLVLSVLAILALSASAAPIINVGTHQLLEDTANQPIQVTVTGGDSVTGFNLKAQIGDGSQDSSPVFESFDYTGGIWDAHSITVTGGPLSGDEQFAQGSVVFTQTTSVPADGLLLTMYVDTTGYFDGETFNLKLKDTLIGVDSAFIVEGGNPLSATITNGSIEVVPEPATMSLLGVGAVALIRRRRRKA